MATRAACGPGSCSNVTCAVPPLGLTATTLSTFVPPPTATSTLKPPPAEAVVEATVVAEFVSVSVAAT